MPKKNRLIRGRVYPKVSDRKELARKTKNSFISFIENSLRPNPAFTGRAIAVLTDGSTAVVEVRNGIIVKVVG